MFASPVAQQLRSRLRGAVRAARAAQTVSDDPRRVRTQLGVVGVHADGSQADVV